MRDLPQRIGRYSEQEGAAGWFKNGTVFPQEMAAQVAYGTSGLEFVQFLDGDGTIGAGTVEAFHRADPTRASSLCGPSSKVSRTTAALRAASSEEAVLCTNGAGSARKEAPSHAAMSRAVFGPPPSTLALPVRRPCLPVRPGDTPAGQ